MKIIIILFQINVYKLFKSFIFLQLKSQKSTQRNPSIYDQVLENHIWNIVSVGSNVKYSGNCRVDELKQSMINDHIDMRLFPNNCIEVILFTSEIDLNPMDNWITKDIFDHFHLNWIFLLLFV